MSVKEIQRMLKEAAQDAYREQEEAAAKMGVTVEEYLRQRDQEVKPKRHKRIGRNPSPKLFQPARFENCKTETSGKTNAIEMASLWTDRLLDNLPAIRGSEHHDSRGVLLLGDLGRGKTWLAYAVVNESLELRPDLHVEATTMVDLLSELRNSFNDKQHREDVLTPYLNCDLLVIDDLGKERSTPWAVETLYRIVDHRYRLMKPVLITSNLTKTQIAERSQGLWTPSPDLDASAIGAIYERIIEMTEGWVFTVDGPSERSVA